MRVLVRGGSRSPLAKLMKKAKGRKPRKISKNKGEKKKKKKKQKKIQGGGPSNQESSTLEENAAPPGRKQ